MMIDRYLKHIGASIKLVNPAVIESEADKPHAMERRQITVDNIAQSLAALLLSNEPTSYTQDRMLMEWCEGAAAGIVAAGEARWKTG